MNTPDIPDDLREAFIEMKDTLKEITKGKYEATPLYSTRDGSLNCGIFEKKKTHTTKLHFHIIMKYE